MSDKVIIRSQSISRVVIRNDLNFTTVNASNVVFDDTTTSSMGIAGTDVQSVVDELAQQVQVLQQRDHYTHSQPSVATQWTIHHNMGKHPTVQTFNASLVEIDGVVTHINNNTLIVDFNFPISGVAYLN